MRNIGDHFGIESWADFVRGQATRELAAPMQEHLNRGCDSCAREAELWQKISTLARREQESEPPFADVRCAKALFSGFRTRNLRSFKLRFARLTGFNRPA